MKAKLPAAGFHALRRSYALALHERGVAGIDVRDLMGHADVRMTEGVYQREGNAEALLARLERAVGEE